MLSVYIFSMFKFCSFTAISYKHITHFYALNNTDSHDPAPLTRNYHSGSPEAEQGIVLFLDHL